MRYLIYDNTGKIIRVVRCPESMASAQTAPGEYITPSEVGETGMHRVDVATLDVIQLPNRPTDYHVFDYTSNQWVDGRTPADIQSELTSAVQSHLDATARTRNYDDILSLCSYASSPHPKFGPEGQAGVAWRDAVWAKCYEILAEVEAQQRPIPTEAELLAELPVMVWPA